MDFSLGLGLLFWREIGRFRIFLLGLLCCRMNDGMSIFLLPVVVYSKEDKGEERSG